MSKSSEPTNPHVDPDTFNFTQIPSAQRGTAVVELKLLHLGHLKTYVNMMYCNFSDSHDDLRAKQKLPKYRIPVYGWLLTRKDPLNGKIERTLVDLGTMSDCSRLPPGGKAVLERFEPVIPTQAEVKNILKKENIQVDQIFLTHAHFDHYGEMEWISKDTDIWVGPGTNQWINGGDENGGLKSFPSRFLANRKLMEFGTDSTESNWQKLGPFNEALDWYHDGSLWIIKAPGHCPGNLVYLARVSANPDRYVLIAGDAAHSEYVYQPDTASGERLSIGKSVDDDGTEHVMFNNLDQSYDTIGRLTRMHLEANVIVVAAHEVKLENVLKVQPGGVVEGWSHWDENGWKEKKV